jgi:ribosome recycling factor
LFVGACLENDSRSDTVEAAAPDIGPTVKSAATAQMETAVVALSRELSKLRTGRASPGIIMICCYCFCWSILFSSADDITNVSAGMLDHIMVETADVKVGLNRIAVVSVLDSHTLSVMPYDPNVRTFLRS